MSWQNYIQTAKYLDHLPGVSCTNARPVSSVQALTDFSVRYIDESGPTTQAHVMLWQLPCLCPSERTSSTLTGYMLPWILNPELQLVSSAVGKPSKSAFHHRGKTWTLNREACESLLSLTLTHCTSHHALSDAKVAHLLMTPAVHAIPIWCDCSWRKTASSMETWVPCFRERLCVLWKSLNALGAVPPAVSFRWLDRNQVKWFLISSQVSFGDSLDQRGVMMTAVQSCSIIINIDNVS